jgi:hypothetical protein
MFGIAVKRKKSAATDVQQNGRAKENTAFVLKQKNDGDVGNTLAANARGRNLFFVQNIWQTKKRWQNFKPSVLQTSKP